jgi:hypothetical protein
MTDKEVMQIALETAEQIAIADYRHWEELASLGEFERWARSRANHIAEALRARLAQPESGLELNKVLIGAIWDSSEIVASPQREWQGLTDGEREQIEIKANDKSEMTAWEYAHRVGNFTEAKLKEKNG